MSTTTQGVLWMLGTIVSFSLMAMAGREVSGQLDTFEIMLYRSAVGLLIMMLFVTWRGTWGHMRTVRLGQHALRNICHFIGQNLWFFAVGVIPLAQVFALEFTTPIWVLILSPLLLSERLTWVRAICAALGFVGILIVTRPGSTELSTPVIAGAACAIFFALTIILTKRLTQTEPVARIIFYLTAMQLVMGLLSAGADFTIARPHGAAIFWVILIGLAGLSAHICYTKALSLAPATVVTPVDFARLPSIALLAWLFYNEPLDPMVFLGALVIFGANYLNIWSQTKNT